MILLDTNFLVWAVKYKIRLPRGSAVPYAVIRELGIVSRRKGGDAKAAGLALLLVKNLPKIKVSGPADRAILSYAAKHRCAVATNDAALIKALKASGVKVLRIRQRKLVTEA
jgi:rRNA-processing protein FCF1